MKKLLSWIIKKDKTGIFEKAKTKVAELYRWAGDTERAKEIIDVCDETESKKSSA